MEYNSYRRQAEASLGRLKPISLEELGSLSLMNRVEIKYLITLRKLPELLAQLPEKYKVLEIAGHRLLPYSSAYLDTADSLFYNQHVRGQLDRYKIRYRRYESTDTSFLEVKRRTNKGRTIKWRIQKEPGDFLFDPQAAGFIGDHSPVSADLLRPVLMNRFTRITLAGTDLKERITIDFNITFSHLNGKGELSLPYLSIVELKKDSFSAQSYFRSIIKNVSARPTGFSKYCIGSCLLDDSLKKNILKPKLLLLKKLENEYT